MKKVETNRIGSFYMSPEVLLIDVAADAILVASASSSVFTEEGGESGESW